MENVVQTPLVHQIDERIDSKKNLPVRTIAIASIIMLAGIGSGFLLSKTFGKTVQPVSSGQSGGTNNQTVGIKAGNTDSKVFSDSAEGDLDVNTSKTEGSYKLIRPGGESQTVYLTSSVLDLSQYVGKKVRVWGQTFAAKQAGWLMDVGKIEVLQ